MCEYCEEHGIDDGVYWRYSVEFISERQESKYNPNSFTGIEMFINQKNELDLFAVVDGENVKPLHLNKTIKINYCPMCGRKLDKEE